MSKKRATSKKKKKPEKTKKATVSKPKKQRKPLRPDIERASSLWDISIPQITWSAVRGIIGLLLLALGLWPLFETINENSWLSNYYDMGHPSSLFGAAAGLALLLTCFSTQIFAPLFILAGSILVIAHNRLDTIGQMFSQHLSPTMLFFAGLTFVASGFILNILGWNKRD